MSQRRAQAGYTLVEVVIAVAIAATLLAGLQQLLATGMAARDAAAQQTELARQARFAMARMVDAVRNGTRLILPFADMPGPLQENIREQTIPASQPPTGSSFATAVLALTIPVQQDLDLNGTPDADNDADGRINEDWPGDINNDGKPGIRGIDDDGDGRVDESLLSANDDEIFLSVNTDPVDGIDNDGDGNIDEDPGADMNGDKKPGIRGVDDDGDSVIDEGDNDDDDEDGKKDEDWLDTVVFYLQGSSLVERRAVPWDEYADDSKLTGRDYVESVIAGNVTLLRFERPAPASGQQQLIDITLTLGGADNATISLNTQVRVGGGS